jgi:hypothetical protein
LFQLAATSYAVKTEPSSNLTSSRIKNDILDQQLLRRPKHKASLDAAWHVTEAAVLSASARGAT